MRRLAFVAAMTAGAAFLAGCGSRDEGTVRLSILGDRDALGEANAGLPSPSALLLRAATVEGLVGFDEEGRVVPALADRWIVTEDGQSYIFRLRNGTWPDGTAITGESAAAALKRTLRTLRGTPLALDLAAIDEIRAMAGRVVEIRLTRAVPDLLDMLAQPELGLPHKDRGAGPMQLVRQGRNVELTPIAPELRGLPAEEDWGRRVRVLRVRAEPARTAVQRFDEGYVDVVLGGTADTLPLVKTAGLSRGTVRLDPVIGLFGFAFAGAKGFLADPLHREALAMAIGRETLLAEFNVAGWLPTTRVVSPGVEDDPGTISERWSGLDPAARRQIAAARVARWRAGGKPLAAVRIALPDTPGGTTIFAHLRRDLAAIGLEARRVESGAPADLRLVDRVARYGRTAWFLNQLSCTAKAPVCSPEADAKAAEALAASDRATRQALLAEAEGALTAANGFIPLARPLRWSLVRGDIAGFAANPWGFHPLLPLALAPR
ncbi:MAG: ABC transporter substrate-binding protein [Novosphingobium sp.]